MGGYGKCCGEVAEDIVLEETGRGGLGWRRWVLKCLDDLNRILKSEWD